MDPPLKTILQLHLASDASALQNLPYIIESLNSDSFSPSSHLQKWIARVNSLLHSKDVSGRWIGLCLAQRTAVLSKSLMIESGQSWLGVALPLLSKKDPAPVIKSAVHLCRTIFSSAVDIPEFQRQVSTPNVPKFNAVTIALLEGSSDSELRTIILDTLTCLLPLYPNVFRASHTPLSNLALRLLSGGILPPPSEQMIHSASKLYAALHVTGGKVGAANLWRKSVDETLEFGWNAFLSLRTTFPTDGHRVHKGLLNQDPISTIPLNLERLSSITHRPVQVPVGLIATFAITQLIAMPDEKIGGHVDPTTRAMEVTAVPEIWKLSCELITCLAYCAGRHLSPNQSRILSCLAYHLEQSDLNSAQRLPFLTALESILTHCHPLHSDILSTRLTKAIIPILSSSRSKKGKKRARGYEGDELFKTTRQVLFPLVTDGQLVLSACDALRLLLRSPDVSPAVHSIASRVVLSVVLYLPQVANTALSPDMTFHGKLLRKVEDLCMEVGTGTSSVMSKSLGLLLAGLPMTEDNCLVDVLLHPRVPPLVRSMPTVDLMALCRADESNEEVQLRESLKLTLDIDAPSTTEDIAMAEPIPAVVATVQAEKVVVPLPAIVPFTKPPGFPPAPLVKGPSTSFITPTLVETFSAPKPAKVESTPILAQEEDEEMPSIDMGSDSDSETE
ncbi:rRNA processing/ribosome biogenesis-domain-containing protein [Mycena floridula]|nr:rRNA processing/ribosome biogenesis-domain-containing protein [Mycena floridula]